MSSDTEDEQEAVEQERQTEAAPDVEPVGEEGDEELEEETEEEVEERESEKIEEREDEMLGKGGGSIKGSRTGRKRLATKKSGRHGKKQEVRRTKKSSSPAKRR
jgi:hypothetical protein